jgi:hypothetical protein
MSRKSHSNSPARRSFLSASYAAALLFVIALSLVCSPGRFAKVDPGARPTASSVIPQAPPPQSCCGGEEGDNKPHLLAGSYYSVKNGLSAKLLLNNKGPHPIEVKPTLFSMGGERYKVAAVTVEGNSFKLLNMSGWIAAAGPQFREGSIQVFHLGRDLVLGVQVYLENDAHSLAFEEKFAEPANFHSSQLRGVWWLPTQKGEVLLALSNTSDSAVAVTARADGQRPARGGSITVGLAPHETRLLNVQEDLFGKGHGAMSRLGGISVEHNGPAGTVLARGFAQESDSGYSLAVQFADPQGAKSSAYQGTGLRLGAAGGEELTPVAVAYNAGTEDATVTGRMPYTTRDGGTAEVSLPEVRLSPGESGEIDIAGAAQAAGVPADVSAAGLEFEYSTAPGSVQMTALSVGAGGNQLFRVPMWDVPAQRSATGGYPWRIEGNSSTFVYLKNTTDQPQDYTFQMSYEGGVYALGLKTIGPRQTIVLDVRALRNQQVPDVYGKTIPLTAKRGQVAWSVHGPDGLAMIGRSEQVDEVRGVSSSYACQYCCPNSFDHAGLSPETVWAVGVGATKGFVAYETDKNCYGNPMMSHPVVSGVTWTSANTSVATIDSSGVATGVAVGSSGIYARWTVTTWTSYVYGCFSTSYTIQSPNTTLNVFDFKILRDGTDITGTTTNVVVGEQVNLSMQVLPAGTSVSNIQWIVPGTAVANYVASNSAGTVTALSNSNLQSNSLTFYWGDAANGRVVNISGKVTGTAYTGTSDGVTFNRSATFNIAAPSPATPTVSLPTNGQLNINNIGDCSGGSSGPNMVFGNISGPLPGGCVYSGQAGITFSPPNTSTPPGSFFFVQLINGDTYTLSRTGASTTCTATNTPGLDGAYPYQNAVGHSVSDAPFSPLPVTYTNSSRDFTATMYLMWQSNTTGSIPVPMGSVQWGFSGSTTQSNGTWSAPAGSGSAQSFVTASGTGSFPQWSGLVGLPSNNCH